MAVPMTSEWITAHAGSGKTYRLTRRVVRLLLLGVPAERIVCITYTKAAASEMRTRVLRLLRQLLLADETGCRALVEEIVGESATEAMLSHARTLFGQVLDSPSGGVVLVTIHGFCQDLLRRFPLEAGISPHFTVLEDQAAAEVLGRVKHTLLTGLSSSNATMEWAIGILDERGGETRFEAWVNDSIYNRRYWEAIWRAMTPELLRERIWAMHGIMPGASPQDIAERLCATPSHEDAIALRALLPILQARKNKTEPVLAQGLAQWLEVTAEARTEHIPALCTLFLTKEGALRANLAKLEAMAAGSPLRSLAEAVELYKKQQAACHLAQESFAVAVLARAVLDLYAQAKAAVHALDYDDLIAHSLQLLSQPQTLGWVMSKLDHRIDHLLIDEAQDNSGEQWQLAQILAEELIANNGGIGSAGLPRSLLVVGDKKQSIYSFQGAAPEQFERRRQAFHALLDGSASPLSEVQLEHSYRSSCAVLQLVDALCAQPEMVSALAADEESITHRLTKTSLAGHVCLHSPVIAPENVSALPLELPLEYVNKTTATELLAQSIAQKIAQWVNVEKRLQAGDILILVHRRKPMVAPLIRALQRHGLPVAGMDRLVLSEHLAVRDLLALIAWVLNEHDDLALAHVLRSPLIGWSDEELRAKAVGRAGSLWREIEHPWLTEIRRHHRATPYDFLTQVLEVSGKRRDFARRFGEEVHEILDALKEEAATIPVDLAPTLAAFHDRMQRSEHTIKREQEVAGNHLRIMTVHGAKGLEAPVVILADTVSVPTTQRERLFLARTEKGQIMPLCAMSEASKTSELLARAKEEKKQALLSEYARLLYVAATRAVSELHIFSHANCEGEVKAGSWYEILRKAMRACGAEEFDGQLHLKNAGDVYAHSEGVTRETPLPDWISVPMKPHLLELQTSQAVSQFVAQPVSPYVGQRTLLAGRGTRIHKVLEHVVHPATREGIGALVALFAPDWDNAARAIAIEEVFALCRQEAWLWQFPRKAELPVAGTILRQGKPIAVHGQIDLLVEMPDTVVLIDYKTGQHVPEAASAVSPAYLGQLRAYRDLIAQIYVDKEVRCALLWTATPKLMWLDEAMEESVEAA